VPTNAIRPLRRSGSGVAAALPGVRTCAMLVGVWILAASSSHAASYFVSPAGNDAAAGTFKAPFKTIQNAINKAAANDTIIIGDGTYTGVGNRDIVFNGKSLTLQSQNGPVRTIVDAAGTAAANHFGFSINTGSPTVNIIGLTIQNGYLSTGGGAGILSKGFAVNVTNCILRHNIAAKGGSIDTEGGVTKVVDTIITDNNAAVGGAVEMNALTTLTRCTVTDNFATTNGGGVDNHSASTLDNCVFTRNVASTGGAVANYSVLTTTASTFSGNSALTGGAFYNDFASATLTDDIFWNDTGEIAQISFGSQITATYCDIQGGFTGLGNINLDPAFVSPSWGDFRLQPGSPCVSAGTQISLNSPTDRDGKARVNPPTIGAAEGTIPRFILPFAIATGSDNVTHALLGNPAGSVVLWDVQPAGTKVAYTYAALTGWTTKSISASPDHHVHILRTHAVDNKITLLDILTGVVKAQPTYNPPVGFAAVAVSSGPDNHTYVLWTRAGDGAIIVWNIAPGGTPVAVPFTPVAGYQAVAFAVGPNGHMRVLWSQAASHKAVLWDVPPTGATTSINYNGSVGWLATALAINSTNVVRLLWNNYATHQAALWTVTGTTTVVGTSAGPYPNLTAIAVSSGTDGHSHVIWTNPADGLFFLWDVDATGVATTQFYGPFAG